MGVSLFFAKQCLKKARKLFRPTIRVVVMEGKKGGKKRVAAHLFQI